MDLGWLDWTQVPPWLVGVAMGYIFSETRNSSRWAHQARADARAALKEVHDVAEELHEHERHANDQNAGSAPDPAPKGSPGDEPVLAPEEGSPSGDDVRPDENGQTSETRRKRSQALGRQIALAVVVLVTSLAAIIAGVNTQRANDKLTAAAAQGDRTERAQKALDQDQADFEARINCQQKFLEAQSIALKARSNFAEEQARVQLRAVNQEITVWSQFLTLTGPSAQQDAVKLINDYVDTLKDQRTAIQDQLTIRKHVQYPRQDEIEVCATVTAENPNPPLPPDPSSPTTSTSAS